MSDLRLDALAPDTPDAERLTRALDADLLARYPPAALHGIAPGDLRDGRGVFLVARLDGRPVGCGALRLLDAHTGEVKRMFVEPSGRRHGVGRTLLAALEAWARERRVRRLCLETGTRQPESIGLYAATGWRPIRRYGEYAADPFSLCFEKLLTSAALTPHPTPPPGRATCTDP